MEHELILENLCRLCGNKIVTDKVLYKCIEFKDIAIYWKHATTLSHKWKMPDFFQNFFAEVVDIR